MMGGYEKAESYTREVGMTQTNEYKTYSGIYSTEYDRFIKQKIKDKSKKLNIDPKITNRIWKNMIWSYIDYERRNFKKK